MELESETALVANTLRSSHPTIYREEESYFLSLLLQAFDRRATFQHLHPILTTQKKYTLCQTTPPTDGHVWPLYLEHENTRK